MDSLTAPSQIEGLDAVLPILEEARHEEALPLIEDRLAKQPDVVVWKYLKSLVLACQESRAGEALSLLTECASQEGFDAGFGLPNDVNTLAKASALNHLQFETTVEPDALEPWTTLEAYAGILGNQDFVDRAALGRWKARPEDEEAFKHFQEHFGERELESRIKCIEEVLEAQPDSCLPRACLGALLQEKGKTALAIRHLKKALDADPQAWHPHYHLGRVFSNQGRFEDAENRFNEAVTLRGSTSPELAQEIANCQKSTYRYEEATETLFKSLEDFPDSFTDWDEISELAKATGAEERLRAALVEVTQKDPDNPDLVARVVQLNLDSQDPLAALEKLQQGDVLENPSSASLAVLAARVLLTLDETEQAVSLLEKALQTHAEDETLRTVYGEALMASDRAEEAEVILKETALSHPNERSLQIAWGRALLAAGQAERAHRAFGLATRLDPNDPEALAEQGLALIALGKGNEATPILKDSAKKSEPPLPHTLSGLGTVYEQKGLKDISKDFFRQALTRDGSHHAAARGWLRMSHSEPTEVEETSLELLQQHSTDFGKCQVFLNLLHSSLREGLAETARMFSVKVYAALCSQLTTTEYREFLDKNLVRKVPNLASKLEHDQELEKAREVWRFAVTSSNSELSQKATAELLRLDTVEAAMVPETPPQSPAPQAQPEITEDTLIAGTDSAPVLGGADDPLLSLLSSTLPTDGTPEASTASSAEPVVESAESLFAAPLTSEPAPAAGGEAPLFAAAPQDAIPASGEEASLFAAPLTTAEVVTPEAPLIAEAPVAAEAPSEVVTPEAPLIAEAPVAAETPAEVVTPEAPLIAETPVAAEAPAEVVTPEAPLIAEAPVAAEAPAEVVTPEAPLVAEAPVAAEAPAEVVTPEAPLVAEAPAAAEAPAEVVTPEAPLAAEAPVAAEAPAEVVTTEAPLVAETPVAAEAPAEVVTTEAPLIAEAAVAAEAPAEVVTPEAPLIAEAPVAAEAPAEVVTPEAPPLAETPVAAEAPAEIVTPEAPPVAEATVVAEAPAELVVAAETEEAETTPTEAAPLPTAPLAAAAPADQLAAEFDAALEIEEDFEQEPVTETATPTQVQPTVENATPDQDGVPRKELLPIPMAVDFEPQTRRQLHFHEALTQSQGGVLAPETIAHLMVCSALTHEPPDPTTGTESTDQAKSLQSALLQSAKNLSDQQQYRGASRILKTALLYAPEAPEVIGALVEVQSHWAKWLADSGEFAHAVSLVRDSSRRTPNDSSVEQQLETIYQAWMAWSDEKGDPAARDLLAVYLQQEQSSLSEFRAAWQAAQAARPAAPVAAASVPPVAPSMPEPAPVSAAPESKAEVPVAATPKAVESTPPVVEPTPAETVSEPPPVAEEAPATEQAAPAAVEPEPETAPEPVKQEEPTPVEAPPAAPAAGGSSFSSVEEALASLDAAPQDEANRESVFQYFAGSMRTLTTALRDRVTQNPDEPLWLLLLARAFRRSGSETMAVIQYQKYIKAAPTPEAYEELALTYEEIGKEDFAKMTRRKAERAFA